MSDITPEPDDDAQGGTDYAGEHPDEPEVDEQAVPEEPEGDPEAS